MTFVERILQSLCPHRFSWPRIGVNGQDYQVCLICGATYEYDWSTMRRSPTPLKPADGSTGGIQAGKPH